MLPTKTILRLVAALFFLVMTSATCLCAPEEVCDVSADLALGKEDYATAIKLHRMVVSSHPANALAHYHLGFAYGMLGQSDDEISQYTMAAKLGLRQWDLFLNLGLADLQRHQLDKAIGAFSTAASLGPQHAEPHFNLALAYESEGRLSDALREIIAARHLAPNNPEAANTSAIILVEMGDFVRARTIWMLLAASAPDYVAARQNLTILNRFLTRYDRSGFKSNCVLGDQN